MTTQATIAKIADMATKARPVRGDSYRLPKTAETVALFERARAQLIAEGRTDLRIATVLRAGLGAIIDRERAARTPEDERQ